QEISEEEARDPLLKLREALVPSVFTEDRWNEFQQRARDEVQAALAEVEAREQPEVATIARHVFSETREDGSVDVQAQGGLLSVGVTPPAGSEEPRPEGARINMVTAIRRTLEHELATNNRVLVFGEDVGRKGGVHAATLGLQEKFGDERVFDTSLSEEGIIGRSVGLALAGLMPVPEIQFRKYADPAVEQLNDIGTM